MEIREYANGKFQVWNDKNEVLRPINLTWENDYQCCHEFMYFSSIKKAQKAIVDITAKFHHVKTHHVTIEINKPEQKGLKC